MRNAGSDQYHLTTTWRFAMPLEDVWAAVSQSDTWPQWWKGAERVVTLDSGDASGLGAKYYYTWKSMLPYRLSFTSRVTRVVPLRLLEGCVEGDLEGTGRCRFEREHGLTIVHYDWQVRTTSRWMNLLAPLAKPIFRWNHDALMRAGGIGLTRHLQACRGGHKPAPS
jgi:uncharacterized protein YndB with AHSA1/START domain